MDLGPNAVDLIGLPVTPQVISSDASIVSDLLARIDNLVVKSQDDDRRFERVSTLEKSLSSLREVLKSTFESQSLAIEGLRKLVDEMTPLQQYQTKQKQTAESIQSLSDGIVFVTNDLLKLQSCNSSAHCDIEESIDDLHKKIRSCSENSNRLEVDFQHLEVSFDSIEKTNSQHYSYIEDLSLKERVLESRLKELSDSQRDYNQATMSKLDEVNKLLEQHKREVDEEIKNVGAFLEDKVKEAVALITAFPFVKEMAVLKDEIILARADHELNDEKHAYLEKATEMLIRKVERLEIQVKSLHLKE